MAKINRVGFGLLTTEDIKRADPMMPRSRKLLAVPFIGKDVPSRASEFSHPDVVIGLTILAYRRDGLRRADFILTMKMLLEEIAGEHGPVTKRDAYKIYWRSVCYAWVWQK